MTQTISQTAQYDSDIRESIRAIRVFFKRNCVICFNLLFRREFIFDKPQVDPMFQISLTTV